MLNDEPQKSLLLKEYRCKLLKDECNFIKSSFGNKIYSNLVSFGRKIMIFKFFFLKLITYVFLFSPP